MKWEMSLLCKPSDGEEGHSCSKTGFLREGRLDTGIEMHPNNFLF